MPRGGVPTADASPLWVPRVQRHKVLCKGEELAPTAFEAMAGRACSRQWRFSIRWGTRGALCHGECTALGHAMHDGGWPGQEQCMPTAWLAGQLERPVTSSVALPPLVPACRVLLPCGARGVTLGHWLRDHKSDTAQAKGGGTSAGRTQQEVVGPPPRRRWGLAACAGRLRLVTHPLQPSDPSLPGLRRRLSPVLRCALQGCACGTACDGRGNPAGGGAA